MRVLVMLYRELKKDDSSLEFNAGFFVFVKFCTQNFAFAKFYIFLLLHVCFADVAAELQVIESEKPFWGEGPKQWHVFMTFGHGRKCADSTAQPSVWATTAPPTGARKQNGRKALREATQSKRARMREEADARFALFASGLPCLFVFVLHFLL